MNDTKKKMPKYKTIFSLEVRKRLRTEYGIEPLFEADNFDHPGYKCQKYEVTPQLMKALNKIMGGKSDG